MMYTISIQAVYSSVNMNKPPISFRLTDNEWELLEREQNLEESINQTAARLLRERLGVSSVDNEYTLKSTTLNDLITGIVNLKIETVQLALENKMIEEIIKLNNRIDLVESKMPRARTRKTSATQKNHDK